MPRYLDFDKVDYLDNDVLVYGKRVYDIACGDKLPFENVAPVIHAHWIEEEDCTAVTDHPWSMCSVCGSYSLKLPYCAFCGAKMDEVK